MKYFYFNLDDNTILLTKEPPDRDDLQAAIDGQVVIFRITEKGVLQILEPIDCEDTDSWSDVPEEEDFPV